MKSNKMYILIQGLLLSISLSAQSVLSGKVTNTNNEPAMGATIVVLNQVDSTYMTGTTSGTDGQFEITNLKPDTYILSFSMIGCKTVNRLQQVTQNTKIELDDIVLGEDTYLLSAVTVNGKRTPVKIEPGKMIVNLSSIALSTDGNVLDALRKLPGVIVQNDGTIILNGKSGATVWMDGKLTYLSGENLLSYLRSIPAHSVENIELIFQPSSQYDAAGSAGIIHIQKKRIKEQGIHLLLSSGIERGISTRWNENISLNYRHNNLNMYADYSYYEGKDWIEMAVSGNYIDPVTLQRQELRKDFVNDINRHYTGHYLKTGIEYDWSDKITTGTHVSSNWLNRNKNELTISGFFYKDNSKAIPL
ncbi:MAG: TonB-dependent receptor [Tannerellaceae bacterium]|nr:TonB-dependent receptor [Tannerellaceae bacterium]